MNILRIHRGSGGVHGVDLGIVHPFLAVRDDPHRRYFGLEDEFGFVNMILAGSGGLLIHSRMKTVPQLTPPPVTRIPHLTKIGHRTRRQMINPAIARKLSTASLPSWSTSTGKHFWSSTPLHTNPGSSQSQIRWMWVYCFGLSVDTISQTYTVTLTFADCVCLYSSTSNPWRCRRFSHQGPWGPHNPELLVDPWETQIASAYVNGRLFFVDVVIEDSIPIMNLIEIDAEAGSWKLHRRYALRTLSMEFVFVDTPFHRMRGLTDHGMHQAPSTRDRSLRDRDHCVPDSVLKLFQIVECMGELYAVIPMGLKEYLPMILRSRRTLMEVVEEYLNFELCFMPLQFRIVSMRRDGFVHAVLRILESKDMILDMMRVDDDGSEEGSDSEEQDCTRQNDLLDLLGEYGTEPFGDFRWHYSCVAEGSVIWVSLMDYVLQYDGSPDISLDIQGKITVPYRPSSMKP